MPYIPLHPSHHLLHLGLDTPTFAWHIHYRIHVS